MPAPQSHQPVSAPATSPAPRRRRLRWLRVALWAAAGAIVAAVLVAAIALLWLHHAARAALPQLDGVIRISGLSAPVTVHRDAHGVPHIDAATQDDLFFAQGYITAQDRLWQMDMLRRHGEGTLAAVLGPSLVRHDKEQRVLELGNTARRIFNNLPPAQRNQLNDYARGVNAYIAHCAATNSLPPEFKLLLYKPAPWTGIDSIAVGMTMVETLDTHIVTKLGRATVDARLRNPKLESVLFPVGSWRDRPPTGVIIDLSKPQPLPAVEPSAPEDSALKDPRFSPAADFALKAHRAANSALKGHGFSRAADSALKDHGFSPAADSALKAHGFSPAADSALKWHGFSPAADSALKDHGFSRAANSALKDHRFSRAAETAKYVGASAPEGPLFRHPPFTPPADLVPRSLAAVLGLPTCSGCRAGSNNWVVSGVHTASGKPLLSNDMHLDLAAPDIWYMAGLRAPGIHVTGVTLPGVPWVIAGHNDHISWGFTALGGDVQDLYVEKLDGQGRYYQFPSAGSSGAWKPLSTDRETIHVRGGRNVTLDIRSTGDGPLLNPLLPKSAPPIALRWTLLDSTLNSIPLFQIDTASNWDEFRTALQGWCWPTQNVVYADDQGHIAYQAVGRIPIRSAGLTEEPIENGSNQWQGYIPFDDMPSSYDPPSGFLATANSRVTTQESKYPITLEWAEPYRAERIYKLLEGRNGLTPADMLAAQTDTFSAVDREFAHRFAYAIDQTPRAGAQLRQAANLLRMWDGRLTTNSAAASIVDYARNDLWQMILKSKLGDAARDYHWTEAIYAEEQIVANQDPAWLPPGYKNWNILLSAAVAKGIEAGHAPPDLSKWTYGSWHVIRIEHPLVRFLPFLSRVAGVGPLPMSGDRTTIKQVGRSFGPSQRFTMDWSNIDGSTENIVLGESGNPLSPYFRDQWNDWYSGKTFPLPFTAPAVAAQTKHTLRLTP